jgi:hypothetical protein
LLQGLIGYSLENMDVVDVQSLPTSMETVLLLLPVEVKTMAGAVVAGSVSAPPGSPAAT